MDEQKHPYARARRDLTARLSLREIAAINGVRPEELVEQLPSPSRFSIIGDDAVCVWTRPEVQNAVSDEGWSLQSHMRHVRAPHLTLSNMSHDRNKLLHEMEILSEKIERNKQNLCTLQGQIKAAENRLRELDRDRESRESRHASIERGTPACWPWKPPMPAPKSLRGVYRLLKEARTVYIGQSINIIGRVTAHAADKDFDQFSYAVVDGGPEALNEVESALIIIERPPLNHGANGRLRHPTGQQWSREEAQAVLDKYRRATDDILSEEASP